MENPLETVKNEFAVGFDRVRRTQSRGANITSNEGQGWFTTCLSGCSVRFTVGTGCASTFYAVVNGCKIV